MTVADYVREFVCLSKYDRKLTSTKIDMCTHFEWGLDENIYMLVGAPDMSRSFPKPPAKKLRDFQSNYSTPSRISRSDMPRLSSLRPQAMSIASAGSVHNGASIEAEQYGKDIVVLKNLVKELHPDPKTQPKVLGTSGYYDEKCFNSFLEVSGHEVVDGVTHHIYNLRLGIQISHNLVFIEDLLDAYLLLSGAWVSGSGGAFHGGAKDVSQTFADGFWHFDQLGMALTYNLKVFCRQTLIGGNYALLNTTTSIPNPDYYGALLWHRLMRSTVLAVTQESNKNLRVYAHCAKKSHNLRSTDVAKPKSKFRGDQNREEYHLAALAGNIQGQIVLLNDVPMVPVETFDIPAMKPKLGNASTSVFVVAHSLPDSSCIRIGA
ncbi:hypothetical protein Goshw_019481 [Gossypium schwendimanii]|uniref:Heparanase-like protein 1 n=1 Tax=Gossypium schwendimanii TaxID=34291 RepID=A0A7J9N369_GOSSC|nr:hypothetical protein [Gossypium schwendimanii]